MVGKRTQVDRAFERCRLLARVVALEYERARANPTDARYATIGVTQQGARKAEAERQIEEAFDDLVALIDHLTILDMAAAFEGLFNARIATAVGGARDTLRRRYPNTLAGRADFVRETDDFQGLSDITKLIEADLDGQVKERLVSVRENRNRFAHGTDLCNPPTILQEDARNALNEAVALLQPV